MEDQAATVEDGPTPADSSSPERSLTRRRVLIGMAAVGGLTAAGAGVARAVRHDPVEALMPVAFTDRSDRETRERAMDIGGFTGMALGAAFAMAVDALVLAKERVPEERAYFRDDAKDEGPRAPSRTASASSARPASAHR